MRTVALAVGAALVGGVVIALGVVGAQDWIGEADEVSCSLASAESLSQEAVFTEPIDGVDLADPPGHGSCRSRDGEETESYAAQYRTSVAAADLIGRFGLHLGAQGWDELRVLPVDADQETFGLCAVRDGVAGGDGHQLLELSIPQKAARTSSAYEFEVTVTDGVHSSTC
ncbi:hypothetical protein ACIB24_03720 [Spongisporangium articulatum]|uniref:Secreted protein n=1 Tax=Spongisporangium articulatum TaxID=3362603 RepID=A0ABW8AII2_9ACTN